MGRGPLDVGGGVPMSPVDFKKSQYRASLMLIFAHVARQIKEMAMSYVAFFSPALLRVRKLDVACHF